MHAIHRYIVWPEPQVVSFEVDQIQSFATRHMQAIRSGCFVDLLRDLVFFGSFRKNLFFLVRISGRS